MVKITIIASGKCKESYYRQAVEEYAKRLRRYCQFQVVETPDLASPEGASDADVLKVLKAEGEAILSRIPDGSYVIAMDVAGKQTSSEAFAWEIERLMSSGSSHIVFIIGGSTGLSEEVLKKADRRISFGPVTMPHRLFRVVLTEQIYRAFRIIRNEPYHK